MKILFNTMNLGKGGAERVINILSNNFVKDNDVMIITNLNMPIEYKFDSNIKIETIEKKHRNNNINKFFSRISLIKLLRLKKIILNYQPDIIISFLPEPSFRVLMLKMINKKIKEIPVIVSVRNDPNVEYNNFIFKFIMKKLYPLANELVLQTNDSKKYFEKEINKSGIVIFNPVSDEFLIPRYDGVREKRIVAVGRLEPQKNYKNMIDAFENVYSKNQEYIFEIYGDGSLKEELQCYIDKKNLHDKIILMGKTDNVKNVIYKATAFVMSSDYEGMPNSLLEAACIGVPCVSTDCPCGGPREILNNGKNGVLVEVNNPKELADGILRIIKDKEFAEKCSKYVSMNSENYSTIKIVSKWMECIKKCIKENKQ